MIGVGKSSLLAQYSKKEFHQQYRVTIGVEFVKKQVKIGQDATINLQIWDTVQFRKIFRNISSLGRLRVIQKYDSVIL